MPKLSDEFWFGIAFAAFALVLDVGVTLAMDAKTEGEFYFAAICFLVASASAVYIVGVIRLSITLPAKLSVPVAWVCIAIVAVSTWEATQWAHARHLRTASVTTSLQPVPPPNEVAEPRLKKQGMDFMVSSKPISPKPQGSAGIRVDQSSDVAIEGNTVVGFDEGIAIQNSIGVVADKNVIKKARLPE